MKLDKTDGSASVGATEYYLYSASTTKTNQTTVRKVTPILDLANMVTGDQFRFRAYGTVNGGTQAPIYECFFTGVQGQLAQLPTFYLYEAYEFSLKLINGSARTIGWSLRAESEGETVALSTTSRDALVDYVWDEALSSHTTAGTSGKALSDASSGGSAPSAATVAAAVWNEATASHSTAGSTGKALTDVLAFGAPPSASTIANAVLDAPIASHQSAGTVGEAINDAELFAEDASNRLPSNLVNGRMDCSVGAMAANVMTASAAAADFGTEIGAAALSAWLASVVDGTITNQQAMIDLVALIRGSATGLHDAATTSTFKRQDDSTTAFTAARDGTAGTRDKAT